jgi:poly-gamma-glutamate synthesis protein (capsule biosynthesis protein)
MTLSESMVDLESLSQPSVMQLAQQGNCQAIAHWLNAYLMPQGVYARVATDRPGCLLILVEFQRFPDRDRLIRFICHRLHQLNSTAFQAVRMIARFIGTALVLWDHTVRLSGQPKRQRRLVRHTPSKQRSPRPKAIAPRSQQSKPTTAMVHMPRVERRPSHLLKASAAPGALLRSPASSKFKHPVLLGSALAAFLLGSGYERLTDFSFADSIEHWQFQTFGDRTTHSGTHRPSRVQTALGLVTVKQQAIAQNPNDPTVTLTFSNDFVLETGEIPSNPSDAQPITPSQSQANLADATQPSAPFPRPSHYPEADIALTNLDQPLRPSARTDSASAKAPGSVDRLVQQGVDVVNLATSQIMENGKTGLIETLRDLETAGIQTIGAGRNRRQARQPNIMDVRGQRIAYLGYSDSETHAAKPWAAGVNAAIDEQVIEDIKAIRDQVDWVIVNYRWSGSLADYPAEWQVRLAHLAIDQGADLVVGHHPDVLQGAEIYKGRAIAYSLGDFVFADSKTSKANYNTAMLKVSIRDQQMRLEFLPVQVRDAQAELVDAERGKTILRYLQQASGLFEQPMQSPTLLNTRSSETLTAPESDPLAPAPFTSDSPDPASSTEDVTPAVPDSFTTYPDASELEDQWTDEAGESEKADPETDTSDSPDEAINPTEDAADPEMSNMEGIADPSLQTPEPEISSPATVEPEAQPLKDPMIADSHTIKPPGQE